LQIQPIIQRFRFLLAWAVALLAGAVALAEVPNPATGPSASNLARVVGQWQYDAYGSVLSAETFATASGRTVPLMHCGHKGLFFDRLDSGGGGGGVVDPVTLEDRPRLIPYAHAVYHVRNRAYQPALGRWMQQDPNATAMSLIEAASHSGRGMGAIALAMSAEDRYGDGYNLYEYLGSNPWNRSDAMGLNWEDDYWEDMGQGAEMALNGVETFGAFTDPGGLLGSVLSSLLENYSMNLEADLDWASDWSQGDDWHSRGNNDWITEAIVIGAAKHFGMDYWLDDGWAGSGGQAMAGKYTKVADIAGEISDLSSGMIFSTYGKAKYAKASRGLGSRWEAHHILPKAWARTLDLDMNGPAVLLQ